MITNTLFLTRVLEIAGEAPKYRLGGYGRDGTCDCIGLTIGAIRRAGGTWSGTHGSNYAARYQMRELERNTVSNLYPGKQVYKAREAGASNNKLPSRYASHPDQRDYYHAGVVTSVDPINITHSTGTGKASSIRVDTSLGAWAWGGRLKLVNYDAPVETPVEAPMAALADAEIPTTAVVTTANGGPLKMRNKPTKTCGSYRNIPCGAEVTVLETDTGSPGWWRVRYAGRTGYVMTQFLAMG